MRSTTEVVPPIIQVAVGVCLFLLSLTFHSLREYSRSRLESICKQYKKEQRLGHILRRDEAATFTAELLFLASLFAFCLVSISSDATPLGYTITAVNVFLFGFLLPKAIGQVGGEMFVFIAWPPIAAATWCFTPVVMLADALDTLFHRMAGRITPNENDPTLISEELRTVIDEGEREGVIESSAGRIIQRLMEIQHEDVTAVMTPRTDMVCIQVDTPVPQVRQQVIDAGHSRVPVFRESHDDLVGILYAKDLLQQLGNSSEEDIVLIDILRDPLYVPESTRIESLLERMRGEHVHMAIVLDEYGGVVGLVTMEDILEEIVGDIEDEFDKEHEEEIKQVRPGTVDVDARVHIDDLNEQFAFALPEDEDYETIGGFVFTQLGKIPTKGETLTWQNLRLTILEADKRKLIKLRIERDETIPVTA
ncbi:hemolysin family protein [Rubinisphaera margarita]|uniref:hemolysin family protein n=1 Tax=Rubinisphaera margarita TaxID=2909586 RepID=UPI001EE81C26|nr:hemolysin family protein [Rubinisphaera margarita]MCG6156851.1 hemolysin family protein [Rubinisphaera margarita]